MTEAEVTEHIVTEQIHGCRDGIAFAVNIKKRSLSLYFWLQEKMSNFDALLRHLNLHLAYQPSLQALSLPQIFFPRSKIINFLNSNQELSSLYEFLPKALPIDSSNIRKVIESPSFSQVCSQF